MRRNIFSLILLLSAVFTFVSCLNTNDDSTYYDDAAITSFTIGTLNRTMHTTSSKGEDSTYTTTVTGSNYKFYIDQQRGLVYNPDSLPIGTRAFGLTTISSKNSGVIVYKSMKSDTLNYYSSSDSVDFSSAREYRVYSTSGANYRTYKISVNVHQQDSDTIIWSKTAINASIAAMKGMKAVEHNKTIYVFGSNGSNTDIYSSSTSDGVTWTKLSANKTLSSDAYKSIILNNDNLYIISDGSVLESSDAVNWNQVATETGLKQLIGGSTTELYALNGSNTISVSKDKGKTWNLDNILDDATKLPTKDIHYNTVSLASNDSTDRIVIVGNRDNTTAVDTTAMVWTKLIEYSAESPTSSWEIVEKSDDNYINYLPDLTSLVVIPYDNGMLAFGGKGVNSDKAKFSQFYQSYDNGITWVNNTHYYFPSGFNCSGTSFTAVKDSNNFIWIFCGDSGQIWKGRLNRLGWSKEQTSFTE